MNPSDEHADSLAHVDQILYAGEQLLRHARLWPETVDDAIDMRYSLKEYLQPRRIAPGVITPYSGLQPSVQSALIRLERAFDGLSSVMQLAEVKRQVNGRLQIIIKPIPPTLPHRLLISFATALDQLRDARRMAQIPLKGVALRAAQYILKNPGQKGAAVAAAIGCSHSHFRGPVARQLRAHGFTNSGDGEGWFPPVN
jgi:hypothetical protein